MSHPTAWSTRLSRSSMATVPGQVPPQGGSVSHVYPHLSHTAVCSKPSWLPASKPVLADRPGSPEVALRISAHPTVSPLPGLCRVNPVVLPPGPVRRDRPSCHSTSLAKALTRRCSSFGRTTQLSLFAGSVACYEEPSCSFGTSTHPRCNGRSAATRPRAAMTCRAFEQLCISLEAISPACIGPDDPTRKVGVGGVSQRGWLRRGCLAHSRALGAGNLRLPSGTCIVSYHLCAGKL